MPGPRDTHHSEGRKLAVVALGSALLVLAFTVSLVGALHEPTPHELPFGLVGQSAAVEPLRTELDRSDPGALDLRTYATPAAARAAIDDREIYGALVPGPRASRLLIASAAGVSVSSALTQRFQAAAAQQGSQLAVVDVRPLPASDRAGNTVFVSTVGIVVAGFLAPTLLLALVPGLSVARRIGAMALFAVVSGLFVALGVDTIWGAISGHFWAIAGIAALTAFAVAMLVLALQPLIGYAATGVAVLAFMIVGIPASGGPVAVELLPGFWRALSPILVTGDAVTALRNTVYFGGAATTAPLLIIGAWAVGGMLVLLGVNVVRGRSGEPREAS